MRKLKITAFLYFFADLLFCQSQLTPPPKALKTLSDYLAANKKQFTNTNYSVLIDYTQPSNVPRFFLLNNKNGTAESFLVAHGKGSDPDYSGIANLFGDKINSHMTPLGFFKTTETYVGKHGYSLKLKGLSQTNLNAESRAIVIHGADYVSKDRKILGRSWGCPALEKNLSKDIIDKIKNGALVYSYHSSIK